MLIYILDGTMHATFGQLGPYVQNECADKQIRLTTCITLLLQEYARSDWLLNGQNFLAMAVHYVNFSWIDGSSSCETVKATGARAKAKNTE